MRSLTIPLTLAAGLWLLGLAVAAPPPGVGPETAEARAERLSTDAEGWAWAPSAAVGAAGTVYVAWAQHAAPSRWVRSGVFVKRWRDGRWEALGDRIGHTKGRDGAHWASAYAPSIGVIGETPYVAWYEGGGYGWGNAGGKAISSSVFVARWDGSQWALDRNSEMPNGALNSGPRWAARTPRLVAVDGILHALWVEDRTRPNSGRFNVIMVKRLVRGQWEPAGPELSRDSKPIVSLIVDIAAADVAGALHVAWTEYHRGGGAKPAHVSVARLGEGGWVRVGAPLNTRDEGYANHVAIASRGGAPYVAWQERTVSGNERLHVKALRNGQWMDTGGPLNAENATGEAGRPALGGDGVALWMAWAEGRRGERARLLIRTLEGPAWTTARGPLNLASGTGAADGPSLAVGGGRVVLTWAEKDPPPATKQVYVRMLR